MMATYGWHFVGTTLRDGSPIPADGVWLPPINDVRLCERGYHGSLHPFDALQHAPGPILTYCEYRGATQRESDKFVAAKRRILCRMDATDMLRYYARMQAVSVIHIWDAPDVVIDYLMTGDDSMRDAAWTAAWTAAQDAAQAAAWNAAWTAAWNATWTAARDAARNAAWTAAQDAAQAAARNDFATLVYECFAIVVNPDGTFKGTP